MDCNMLNSSDIFFISRKIITTMLMIWSYYLTIANFQKQLPIQQLWLKPKNQLPKPQLKKPQQLSQQPPNQPLQLPHWR